MDMQEMLSALREISSNSTDGSGWFTRQELQTSTGITEKRAIALIKSGIEAGVLTVGRCYRNNIAGISTKVIAYREVKQ